MDEEEDFDQLVEESVDPESEVAEEPANFDWEDMADDVSGEESADGVDDVETTDLSDGESESPADDGEEDEGGQDDEPGDMILLAELRGEARALGLDDNPMFATLKTPEQVRAFLDYQRDQGSAGSSQQADTTPFGEDIGMIEFDPEAEGFKLDPDEWDEGAIEAISARDKMLKTVSDTVNAALGRQQAQLQAMSALYGQLTHDRMDREFSKLGDEFTDLFGTDVSLTEDHQAARIEAVDMFHAMHAKAGEGANTIKLMKDAIHAVASQRGVRVNTQKVGRKMAKRMSQATARTSERQRTRGKVNPERKAVANLEKKLADYGFKS